MKINKNTKVYLIYLVTLTLAIGSWIAITKEMNHEISRLESEIEFLEVEQEKLLKLQVLYEEVIAMHEENEDNLNKQVEILESDIVKLEEEREKTRKVDKTSRGSTLKNSKEFTVTCYDLSVASCGKPIGSKGYGITASGISLIGHTWESARAIAVDPKVIPLGSKVEITFTNENYSKYNGIYSAVDKGGAIKGNKIDFFLGDFNQNEEHPDVGIFGKTKAKIRILE